MNTRNFIGWLPLAAILFAATAAQAGEISMENIGTQSGGGSSGSESYARADCASAPKSLADDKAGHASRPTSATSGAASVDRIAADDVGESEDDATSAGGNATRPIGVPIKTRSNRWQSLVPGAIK
jgi:hypothetical protein